MDGQKRQRPTSPEDSPTEPPSKRGPYKPRTAKPIISDPTLDRILAIDLNIVPEKCQVLDNVDQLESPPPRNMVKVGDVKDPNSLGVFIMPFYSNHLGKVMVKQFNVWKEDKKVLRKDIPSKEVQFFDDVLDGIFDGNAAKSRWSTTGARKSARDEWLLEVWQYVTNESLPNVADESTAARKVRMKHQEAEDSGSINSKKHTKPRELSKSTTELSRKPVSGNIGIVESHSRGAKRSTLRESSSSNTGTARSRSIDSEPPNLGKSIFRRSAGPEPPNSGSSIFRRSAAPEPPELDDTMYQSIEKEDSPSIDSEPLELEDMIYRSIEEEDSPSILSKSPKLSRPLFSNTKTVESPSISSQMPSNLIPRRPTGYTPAFLDGADAKPESPLLKAWQIGKVDGIETEAVQTKIKSAYEDRFPGSPPMPCSAFAAAYQERLQVGALTSESTTAWRQAYEDVAGTE